MDAEKAFDEWWSKRKKHEFMFKDEVARAAYLAGYQAGQAAEREQCASICDDLATDSPPNTGDEWAAACLDCGAAIRGQEDD